MPVGIPLIRAQLPDRPHLNARLSADIVHAYRKNGSDLSQNPVLLAHSCTASRGFRRSKTRKRRCQICKRPAVARTRARPRPSQGNHESGPPLCQSSKVRRGPSPVRCRPCLSLPLAFCSGASSGSGCTLLPSPHGKVAVIGDENAGRAPANPRTDGAAYARASPFHTNYFP